MPAQAKLFATKSTYLYYTRYYDMVNKMDEIRRSQILSNINKAWRIRWHSDPNGPLDKR